MKGKELIRYYGIVSGETIIGANVFRDFLAGIRDFVGGRSGAYEEVLRQAKDTAIREMEEQAARLGANAVIGVDLDYETVGGSGSMLMVTAYRNCGNHRIEYKNSPIVRQEIKLHSKSFVVNFWSAVQKPVSGEF